MAHILQSGSTFRVSGSDADIINTLPAANYVLKLCQMTGFYLERSESFTLPDKIYGNCTHNSQRVLQTFSDRKRNTGVLLVGEKGSGKTLLMRKISIDSGLPVIIINSNFTGDGFNSFLTSITQPCIVLFDEFEKIYDKAHQERVLTLLDGTYQSNKLFLITSNNKWSLDANMKNRPGRIYYMFEFYRLEEQFIREYCEDNLHDKSKINRIIAISNLFSDFNFDMLAAIVEEINRYGEEPSALLSVLNTKPEYSGNSTYNVTIKLGDYIVPSKELVNFNPFGPRNESYVCMSYYWNNSNPFSEEIKNLGDADDTPADKYIEWLNNDAIVFNYSESNSSNDYRRFWLKTEYITKTDERSITYDYGNGITVILTKEEPKQSLAVAYAHL